MTITRLSLGVIQALILLLRSPVNAFVLHSHTCTSTRTQKSLKDNNVAVVSPGETPAATVACKAVSASGMWNAGLNFGKGPFRFYTGYEDWMAPFTTEDREAYPDLFVLPHGVYEVNLRKPLGIVFEEIEPGRGVFVADLVPGGNAEGQGVVQQGDVLLALTAVKIVGAKWERRMIPAKNMDFDTVVDAIGSNDERWGCYDVILQFERPGEADEEKVKNHLGFFEPPFDNPWKTG